MSFDLKAFVKKSWDTFRGGQSRFSFNDPRSFWRPSDGLLALLNKPELVAGLIPHIPEYISDLTTSSTEELSDKANELLGLDPGTLTADNLGVFLGYIRDETPEAFNSVLAELTGTTPLEVFQAVYEYSSKKAVDSLGLDGVPTNTTDPKWYAYFDELQNILGAGGRSREEAAEDYFRQAGYEPSPEELEEILMGDAFPTRTAIEVYVDPRQVTNDEVIERLERVGIDVEGQAEAAGQTPEEYAEQIKQSIPPGDGSEAAFDDAMIMSLTSTAAGGTGSASFKEALSKMGTGVKNLLFGTNSGSPKPWLQILKEQIEKKYFPTFEDQMPGFPLEIVFDLDGASAANPTGALVRANLKIPVPFPVNGPPIVIPLFSENGTYIGPTTPKGLLVDPETGIITQVKEGIEQTVGQIKGEVVQVLGAAGDVIRSFPLGLLENPDWKEGDPNPFELEVDGNGDIAPQTDENGNPATGYAPDTGLPVYEQLDEEEEEEEEEAPVVSRSPYEDGSASDAFRNSSWPDPDPDAQDTYSRQIEQMFLDYGLDTNQWPEGNSLNITRRDGQPVDANGDGVYTVEELAAVGITRAAGYDPRMFLGNDARFVLDTLEDTLDGLGLDIDDIETILGSIQTDLQNVTTAEDLETFRINLIAELTDPDTGLSSMGIDADELATALDTALTDYATTAEVNTAITTAINALNIPTDTVRSDEDIKRIAQGIVDNLDLPEDTQISDEDLTTAISTYLTNNGYITSTRTDEEINTLIGTALTGYATTTEVNTAITTAINALDIPTDTVRSDEDIKRIAQGIVDNLDLPEDTQISDEDLTTAISTYLTDNGYITSTRTDEEINTLIGTALTDYATVKGVQDTIDTYFGADGSVTKTLTALGFDTDEIKNIIGTPSNYTDPITKEVTKEATGMYALVEGAATPQDIIDAVGAPTTNESGEVIGGTGLYGDLFTLGVDVERIEGAIGNKDEGTGLYGYIDAAVQDLATVDDVERIVGVPDFIEGTDEDGNPTRELTDKSTGLYLDFYNAGVDYDTVINLIGVPDDPSTPDVNEGRGLFGYVGESNEAVKTYIDTLLGDVPGQVTEIQGDVNTLVEYVGSPGADVDDPNTEIDERLPTGLHALLINNGVAIDAIPGIIEGIVGVPEFGVDDDGNPTTEIVGGTGLYGEVVSLNTDVDTVIASINNTVIPQITEVAGFIGKPATVDKDGNVIPATGLHKIIEDYAGDSELRDGAITDAINKFTSDGAYTIEQVLTAIDTSNTDIKNFIGSPGADVDDPNTPEDETLPTGIYEGIAISEGRIIDAVSESEGNTNEYLTYISQIIGVPATELTQEDIDTIVGLIGEDEAITELNNDNRLYDVNFDGVINDIDIGILQGYVDIGVEGVGEIPASGLYGDAARRQFETQGFISDQDDITRGLISSEEELTRGLVGQTALFNAMMGAGDITGRRVDVTTPDPARINYMYDFEDIFATPQQKGLFPSPYGGPQRAQQQQIAQKRGIMSGPLQIGGMAQGGKVDYDFTDEIMQIMSYGDNQ
jgi:guanyl-specific ribonuclease Sa